MVTSGANCGTGSVEGCAGGSAFMRPGSRKSRGETLLEALIPPQPVPQSTSSAANANPVMARLANLTLAI